MSKESRISIDEYLETVPEESRAALAGLRELIRASAPGAEETISYRIPTFKYEGPLVGFAAFKSHLSFFVMSPSVMEAYESELAAFDNSRGTIRFQADEPLPAALVRKLVMARLKENEARAAARASRGGSRLS